MVSPLASAVVISDAFPCDFGITTVDADNSADRVLSDNVVANTNQVRSFNVILAEWQKSKFIYKPTSVGKVIITSTATKRVVIPHAGV